MTLTEFAQIIGEKIIIEYQGSSRKRQRWVASMKDGNIKDGIKLFGCHGRGQTAEIALCKLAREMRGKLMVFNATNPVTRREMMVPDSVEHIEE